MKIEPGSDVGHRRSILTEFVVPEVSSLRVFKLGIPRLNDGAGTGTCVAEFQTQEDAERALEVLAPSNGPDVIHVGTCEVELEA